MPPHAFSGRSSINGASTPSVGHAIEQSFLKEVKMPLKIGRPNFEDTWGGMARILLQVEMKKRDMKYEELTQLLNMGGANENVRNVRNKIARGTFSAGFFLMCMIVMGVTDLKIELNPTKIKELGIT